MVFLLFLVGLAGFAFFVWSWRGRTPRARSWTRDLLLPYAGPMVLLPSVSLGLIAGALGEWGWDSNWVVLPLGIPMILIFLIGVPAGIIGAFWWPARRLWGPRWYVYQPKEKVLENKGQTGRWSAQFDAARPSWGEDWVSSVPAVQFSNSDHPARKDAASGYVYLSTAGLWFYPDPRKPDPDRRLAAEWSHVKSVRIVCPTCNAEGAHTSRLHETNLGSRLAVKTDGGTFLFQIVLGQTKWFAKKITAEMEK